jgi:hypothetical protein
MPEAYEYYVPVLVTTEEKVGFDIHIYQTDHLINSTEEFFAMLDAVTRKHVPEPEKGTLPVIPLNFVLISGKRGPGVKPLKPKDVH